MQFFRITDQSKIKHKVLNVKLSTAELKQLGAQCEKCLPTISVSSMIQAGHPFVIFDFSGWKTAIDLDEKSHNGHRIGDELEIGDVVNVILTSDAEALTVNEGKVRLNVPLESILSYSFLYTAEIAENYSIYKMIKQPPERKEAS